MELIRSYNMLSKEEVNQFDLQEFASNIYDTKTNKIVACFLEYESLDKLNNDLVQIKDLNCHNILLKGFSYNNIVDSIELINNALKNAKISITKTNELTNDLIFDLITKYKLAYYINSSNECLLDEYKTFKKHLSFVILNDCDNYGFNTLAGSTLKTRELIDYLRKKKSNAVVVINTNLYEFNKLRNTYLEKSFFKRLKPSKINKAMKVFNYKISSNEKIEYLDLIRLETDYIKKIIK